MQKLKAYSGYAWKEGIRRRAVCAAFNQAEVEKLICSNTQYVRMYWCLAYKPEEVRLAMANPHKLVFIEHGEHTSQS